MRGIGHVAVQFKWLSLLEFDGASHDDENVIGNLRRLYQLNKITPDSQMREFLDTSSQVSFARHFARPIAAHSAAMGLKTLQSSINGIVTYRRHRPALFEHGQVPAMLCQETP